MGRRGGRKGRGARGGSGGSGGGGGGWSKPIRTDFREVQKTNDLYEKYYNELELVPENERDEFWTALRRDLPNSFRFTGSKGQALPVQDLLKSRYIPEITSILHNEEPVQPPAPIPWYPDQLAWQMTTPKNVVRRFPPFAHFQKFLVAETSVGNISRQEIVSMIPPLLMDIKPGMTVLDMCAAPGSKAAQLIEMVHGGEEARTRKVSRQIMLEHGRELSPEGDLIQAEIEEEEREGQKGDWSDDGRATGLLIANDADYRRAHMLTHQMKRLNSPNLIVTNHDATMFPSIKLQPDPAVQGTGTNPPRPVKYLKFDRILADVPCSGDGTCRKNSNVWKDWAPGNALGLHPAQVRILVRALQMLKVGGRVVYSTCSLHPVENEAVITTAIDRCGGSSKVKIVDLGNDRLPLLKRKPGLTAWKVMDKQSRMWSSWDDVEEERVSSGDDGLGRLAPGMFPPPKATLDALHLEHCMRIYPHLQDTGGFFIAVLEKESEIKTRPEDVPSSNAIAKTSNGSLHTSTSIVDAVNEIESQQHPTGSSKAEAELPKIEALDAILPPTSNMEDEENTSAAARQNQANALDSREISGVKRSLDAAADAESATKRPKVREEVDEPAEAGLEDRKVHWPPPPAAEIDIPSMPPPKPVQTTKSANVRSSLSNRKPNQIHEEPFKYLSPDFPDLASIQQFYSLSHRFPLTRFMVRNASGLPAKTIYYTSDLARSILTANANSGIKFIHCGVKMFVKQDVQAANVCPWRVQSEGLPILAGWIGLGEREANGEGGDNGSRGSRIVRLWRKKTLRALLVEMFPKVEGGGWRELGEIGERVRDISMGCCILQVGPPPSTSRSQPISNGSHSKDGHVNEGITEEQGQEKAEKDDEVFTSSQRMVLPLWRSLHSLNLMLPKEDRKAMLIRLFDDDTPLMDHSKDRHARRTATAAAGNGDVPQPRRQEKGDGDSEVEAIEEEGGDDVDGEEDEGDGATAAAVAAGEIIGSRMNAGTDSVATTGVDTGADAGAGADARDHDIQGMDLDGDLGDDEPVSSDPEDEGGVDVKVADI